MKTNSLNDRIAKAVKWSTITQVSTKMITPITNMILARLLAPDAFGVVATVTMVVSFCDMFTDVGFQKYLIQHEFKDERDRTNKTNVAFWTNLVISIVLWLLVIVFRDTIATMVGNKGLGDVIGVACIQLPLTAFSSIQVALYRRDFDFKILFIVQNIAALLPLVITVPLAFAGYGYWSIIIGSTSGVLVSAIIFTIKSKWKPSYFYSFKILQEMLAFSVWSLLETISVWMILWVDIFIISSFLNNYYLGLYKNSLNIVNALMTIVTASVAPILFSALSRFQNDSKSFCSIFLSAQKIVGYFVFPMGVGIFLYRDIATKIMLGSQWAEASNIIGIWALTSALRIVMVSIYSDAYRAKGKPKLCLIIQILDLIILVPTCLISLIYGFWELVYARSLMRLFLILPSLIVMDYVLNIKMNMILRNICKPALCTLLLAIAALCLKIVFYGIWWEIFSIVICIPIYVLSIYIIAKNDFSLIMSMLRKRI